MGAARGADAVAAGQVVFPRQNLERWSFDVELLYVAKVHGLPCADVTVAWSEIDGACRLPFRTADPHSGSHVSWRSMVHMFLELVQMRLFYLLDVWRAR